MVGNLTEKEVPSCRAYSTENEVSQKEEVRCKYRGYILEKCWVIIAVEQ